MNQSNFFLYKFPLCTEKKFTVQTFEEDPQFFKFLIATRDNIKIAKNWLEI